MTGRGVIHDRERVKTGTPLNRGNYQKNYQKALSSPARTRTAPIAAQQHTGPGTASASGRDETHSFPSKICDSDTPELTAPLLDDVEVVEKSVGFDPSLEVDDHPGVDGAEPGAAAARRPVGVVAIGNDAGPSVGLHVTNGNAASGGRPPADEPGERLAAALATVFGGVEIDPDDRDDLEARR